MYLSDIVSIHLMLLFIRSVVNPCYKLDIVSIHLMLLFIPDRWIDFKISLKFQYISCYSLSYFSLSIFNSSMGFNTSHVTLYHCYAFSHVPTSVLVSIHLMLLFIFLMELRVLSIFSVSIHLMLLFIRKRVAFYKFFTIVSIHLMLLFIILPDYKL